MKASFDYFFKPRNVLPDCRLFSPEHLILSALSVLCIIVIFIIQLKQCNENYSNSLLKLFAITMLALEIFRLIWMSYYYGFGLNTFSFGWCNQICLVLPFIVLTRRKDLFPYVDMLSFIGGAGVIIYPVWVYYDYAGLHIMSLQSMISHTLMVIIPMSMSFVSDHWKREKNIKKPLIGFGIMAFIALVMTKTMKINFMIMRDANGIPLLNRFIFPWYWSIALPCVIALFYSVMFVFEKIDLKISKRKSKNLHGPDVPLIIDAQPENTPL